ncbi:MAG: AMP-dependent synthetase/ligase [Parasutterella excrementihominis]
MTADNLNNMRVIPDLLAINEKVRPNKVAYRQFDDKSKTWISVTWKEFADMVRSWRKAFTASGLSKGDHAAVLLPNSITATACDLSILSQGMVPVPLHAVDTPSSSAFILNNSEAKILFVPRTLRWNAMLNAQKEYPYLKLVVTTGNDAEGASEDSPVPVVNLSDWLKQGENTDLKEVSIDPDDLAAIVYTSGTTGKPKGVMLTHDNVLSNVKSFSQVIDVGSDDVFLSFLPFSHTFERTVTFYFTLFLGAEVGFARSVLKLAEDLKIIRPTIFVAVPRVFEQFHSRIKASLQSKGSIAATLADQAEMIGWRRFCRRNGLAVPSSSASWLDSFIWPMLESRIVLPIRDVFGGRLRIAIAGGAALNNAIGRFYNAMGVELRQGYGLTETSPVISVNRENCNNPVTVGQPIPGLQIRLGDIEELQVKGPTVMKGYWKRPDATAEVFTEDGWFRTGDQADLSDAGRIRIKGRIKEIIVTSTGEKIPPTDMELAIQTDPLFEQVMVVGEARPFITALAVVNEAEWEKFAKEFNVDPSDDRMLMRRDIRMAALKRLKKAASRFPQYGIPRNIRLLKEHWTVDKMSDGHDEASPPIIRENLR